MENSDDNSLSKGTKKVKILIVEDNPINQIVIKKFLEKWEAEYEIVDNGQKALEIVQIKAFDLILMDIQMPIMDGYSATKKIRSLDDEKYIELPIIALTAGDESEIKTNIKEAGMNEFLTKPFNPDELFSLIKRYL
jgi:CheY-like chemotaxis protein